MLLAIGCVVCTDGCCVTDAGNAIWFASVVVAAVDFAPKLKVGAGNCPVDAVVVVVV